MNYFLFLTDIGKQKRGWAWVRMTRSLKPPWSTDVANLSYLENGSGSRWLLSSENPHVKVVTGVLRDKR